VTEESAAADAKRLPAVLLVLVGLLALLHLALPLVWLGQVAQLNYNEGWNAYHAEAVLSERPLYPAPDALFPNNYPPLSFGIVAPLGALLGDPIRAGRLLSLLSLLAIGGAIAAILRRACASTPLGLFGGLLFVALLSAAFPDYVCMNDPQLTAHALMLTGLALLLGGHTPARAGSAALLMILGGLVKHNLIALPLAVTLWLWGRDRAALRWWLAASAGLGLAALASLWLLFGASPFESIFAERIASLRTAARGSSLYLPSLAAPLAIGLLAARPAWRDRDARLLVLYAALSLAIGFAFTAGEGVSHNAYFDLLIALCLLGPWLVSRAPRLLPGLAGAAPALALGLLLGPGIGAPDALLGFGKKTAELAALESATRADIDLLAARAGPALCESLALCFWAGKPVGVDLFNSRQAFHAGRADEAALLARLARSEFSVVQLTALYRDRDDSRVSAQFTRELLRNYVIERNSANGVFLRPRRGPTR